MADPSDSEQTSPPERGSLPWGMMTAFLVLLPVIYALSVGPAVCLYRRGILSPQMQRVIEVVYAPLEQVYHAAPVTQPFLDKYVEWWLSL